MKVRIKSELGEFVLNKSKQHKAFDIAADIAAMCEDQMSLLFLENDPIRVRYSFFLDKVIDVTTTYNGERINLIDMRINREFREKIKELLVF